MIFKLNQETRAMALNAGEPSRINEGGAYIGKFKQAYITVFDSGAENMEFDFVSASGQTANLSINVMKKDGSPSFGYGIVLSMMEIMGAKQGTEMQGVPGKAHDKNGEFDAVVFKQLCNKPIGLLLQKELNTNKRTGKDYSTMLIRQAFDPKTGKTLKEIAEGKDATTIANRAKNLTVSDKRAKADAGFNNYDAPAPAAPPVDDGFGVTEDIPF